jgi:membrane protease YdiL (CAAX protease family)
MTNTSTLAASSASSRLHQATGGAFGKSLAVLIAFYLGLYVTFEMAGVAFADLGYWGWLLTGVVVFGAVVTVERFVYKQPWRSALLDLGLGRPARRAFLVSLLIGGLLLACYPLIEELTGAEFALSGAGLGIVALFARNGIAEEMLYRGFLFRRLRQGRTFRRAVVLLLLLHALAHAPALRFGVAVGLGAILVAAATAAPYALLFERGGNNVWGPAIIHTASDTIMLTMDRDALGTTSTMLGLLAWYVAISTIPYLAFVVRWRSSPEPATTPSSPVLDRGQLRPAASRVALNTRRRGAS